MRRLVEEHPACDTGMPCFLRGGHTGDGRYATVRVLDLDPSGGSRVAKRLQDGEPLGEVIGQRLVHVEDAVDDLDRLLLLDRVDEIVHAGEHDEIPDDEPGPKPGDPELPRFQRRGLVVLVDEVDVLALPRPLVAGVRSADVRGLFLVEDVELEHLARLAVHGGQVREEEARVRARHLVAVQLLDRLAIELD